MAKSVETYAGYVDVLERAAELVYGDRQAQYGSAKENWARVAAIWSAILGVEVSPDLAIACMIGLKLARVARDPAHFDSWVDIAGYVAVRDKAQRGG